MSDEKITVHRAQSPKKLPAKTRCSHISARRQDGCSSSMASCPMKIKARKSRILDIRAQLRVSRSTMPAAANCACTSLPRVDQRKAPKNLSPMDDDEADRVWTSAARLAVKLSSRLPGADHEAGKGRLSRSPPGTAFTYRKNTTRSSNSDWHLADRTICEYGRLGRQLKPSANCWFRKEPSMPKSLTWDDAEDIGILLSEVHPELRSACGSFH